MQRRMREWQKKIVIMRIMRIRRTWNSWPATGWEMARARSGGVLVMGVMPPWAGDGVHIARTTARRPPETIQLIALPRTLGFLIFVRLHCRKSIFVFVFRVE
jgi:hypothetical protein